MKTKKHSAHKGRNAQFRGTTQISAKANTFVADNGAAVVRYRSNFHKRYSEGKGKTETVQSLSAEGDLSVARMVGKPTSSTYSHIQWEYTTLFCELQEILQYFYK